MASIALLFWLFDEWQFSYWKKAIPSGIGISKNIDVGAEYSLFSGCGFVVFKVTPDTLSQINKYGIQALAGATESAYEDFSDWHNTPYPLAKEGEELMDFWQMGMSCGYPDMDKELNTAVYEHLDKPGSFYSLSSHSVVIVIPDQGLVIFSTWE